MSETKQLIEELDKKVASLIEKLIGLRKQVGEKDREIEELRTRLKDQVETVTRLETENTELRSGLTESGPVDTAEVKTKINELVKEIDSCISLLKV